jgi:AcrR family transcriptional regulator
MCNMTLSSPPAPYKRNAAASQARILQAAQVAFSTTGYSHTGIRDIAAVAGVSATLLVRYFGSKANLFEEALKATMHRQGPMEWTRAEYAERMADVLLDPANDIRAPMMIALACGDPEAAAIAARITAKYRLEVMAEWLGGDDAWERALALLMASTGFVIFARQLPLPLSDTVDMKTVRQWFTSTVNQLVSGEGWKD